MNKQKFVDYLRSPERLTEGQFDELQKILTDYPYFSIAKSITARGAKDLEREDKNQFISSAAIYATDRKHLKKYINGELVFLVDPPKISEDVVEEMTTEVDVKDTTISEEINESTSQTAQQEVEKSSVSNDTSTHVPTGDELDQVLDELEQDIKELAKSRMHFLEVQDHIDEAKFTSKVAPEMEESTLSEDSESKETPDNPPSNSEKDQQEPVIDNPEIKELAVEEEIVDKSEIEVVKVTEVKEEDKPEVKEELKQVAEAEKEIEVEEEEEPIVSDKKSTKPEFTLDLEALKREFALESETTEEIETVNTGEPIIIGNMDEDDDEDDADFFPPPPTDSPNSITNMSPDEEEPDDEAEIIQKLPQKSKRKPRKATKMKRDDFEKILGKKPAQDTIDDTKNVAEETETTQKDNVKEPVIKEEPVKEVVVDNKEEKSLKEVEKEVKKENSTKEVEKAEKKKAKKPEKKEVVETEPPAKEENQTKIVDADKSDKVKEAMSQMEKASSISKSQSNRSSKKRPKKDMEANPSPIEIIKSTPKKSTKKNPEIKKEVETDEANEMADRNSVKSFIELGRSKDSTSISRASVSKKRGRTNKSKPSSSDSTKSSGSKDDDESGGASSLIDKFISENPSIQRRDMKDEISDLSQESVKWHPELASEYLAQIYTDQGNKARAITIYEALSLKFPEKKSYFAGLIKKLKK